MNQLLSRKPNSSNELRTISQTFSQVQCVVLTVSRHTGRQSSARSL